LLAGCGGSASSFSPNVSSDALARLKGPTVTRSHLYVALSGFYKASKIYRYPLDANGLPGKTSDGVLILNAQNPGGIAIGSDGDLYVSSLGTPSGCGHKCFVEVFASGASGHAKPVRVLYVPQQPFHVAVDQQGYLDVSTLKSGGQVTNVYAPNAQGHDTPINQISSDVVNALGASNGIAYIETLTQGVEGTAEHSKEPGPVNYQYPPGRYVATSSGVATEGENLYALFSWYQSAKQSFLATAVYRIDKPAAIRTIIGIGCTAIGSHSNPGAAGYGLAAYKNYVYENCIDSGGANGSVLVYNSTENGKQRPVETLTGGDAGVAIGP
jgi:hypothetical protein